MILNAVDHIQNGTGGLEARMTQKELKGMILREYLVFNVCWMIILKCISYKLFSLLDFFSLEHGQGEIFGNVNEVNLHINNNCIQKFCNWGFLNTHFNPRFS